MDFLNQAIGQVRELLLSMTPAARATALLLVGVIAVSLGFLVKHQTASPDEVLFGGDLLHSRDANAIEMALGKAGLNDYERIGTRIKVPRGQRDEYLAAIADEGALPPNFNELLEEALNLGAFTDRVTREQKIKAAREQQLSMIISRMAGIEDATVMFDIQRSSGLTRKINATATVSVLPIAGESLDARQTKRIRQAVAFSIAGLRPDSVNVMNLSDGSMYGSGGEFSSDSFADPYYQTRVAYENLMKSRIEKLLHAYTGATVQVTADIDNRLEHTTTSILPDAEVVAIRETKDEDKSTTSQDENGGRPGLDAQGPTRTTDQTTQSVVRNETTSTETQNDNFVGRTEEYERLAGMVPDSVRATIGIPRSYLMRVWREREALTDNDTSQPLPADISDQLATLENEVKTQVQDFVAPLLPKTFAKENLTNVSVTFFDSFTPEKIEPPTATNQAFSWAGRNFNTISMVLVAMFSLVMLRSLVKAIPPSDPSVAINADSLGIETSANDSELPASEEDDVDEPNRPKLRLKKGTNLTADLTDIVREDPEAAAAILRSWIGNAG